MTKYMAIGIVVLVALLGVSGWLLKRSYAANGALEVKLTNANAIIAQREEDMKLSAKIIAELAQKAEAREAIAAPVKERIVSVPVSAVNDAAIVGGWDGMQSLLANPR